MFMRRPYRHSVYLTNMFRRPANQSVKADTEVFPVEADDVDWPDMSAPNDVSHTLCRIQLLMSKPRLKFPLLVKLRLSLMPVYTVRH